MNRVSAYLSSSIECFNKTVSANFPISKNRLCIASSVSLIVGALGLVLMKKIPATSGLLVTLVGSNLLTQMQLSECNGRVPQTLHWIHAFHNYKKVIARGFRLPMKTWQSLHKIIKFYEKMQRKKTKLPNRHTNTYNKKWRI